MVHFVSSRIFTLWCVDSSHGCLLLRSPNNNYISKSQDNEKTIDILFYGVNYMEIKSFFRGIHINEPTKDDKSFISKKEVELDENNIYVLTSEKKKYYICSSQLYIFSNNLGLSKHSHIVGLDLGDIIYENKNPNSI